MTNETKSYRTNSMKIMDNRMTDALIKTKDIIDNARLMDYKLPQFNINTIDLKSVNLNLITAKEQLEKIKKQNELLVEVKTMLDEDQSNIISIKSLYWTKVGVISATILSIVAMLISIVK